MARKKIGSIEWEGYKGYCWRNVSIDDSMSNEKIVQFYPISRGADGTVTEHVVIDKYGSIVHYGLHGFDGVDFVSTFGIEVDQKMFQFVLVEKACLSPHLVKIPSNSFTRKENMSIN